MKRLMIVAGVLIALLGLVLVMVVGPAMMMASFTSFQRTPVNGNIAEICSAGEAGEAQIPEEYREDIAKAAEVSGISQEVLASQIYQESRWNPKATSSSYARGLAQFKDEAWAEYGNGDPYDGHASIAAQGRFLLKLKNDYKQYSSDPEDVVRMALAGYRIGPAHVHAAKGIPYQQPVAVEYAEEILSRASIYTTECKPAFSGGDDVVISGEWTHPFPGGYFTSDYGARPCPSTLKCTVEVANHNAIDLASGTGTGYAVAPTQMRITKANGTDRDGDHPVFARQMAEPHYVISYWHCAYGSHRVQVGQIVEPGTPICKEGVTGNAGGRPHIHLQFNQPSASDTSYERHTTVNPEPILAANGIDLCPSGRDVTGPCQAR
ncbi:transglycosylase SLT domain-containing protein [Micrococcus sp. 2A]|uniref:transglycosylase SLT domain-containing protein n=1 Tax=Micrococcus sp. 2A TaxID=3142261 RepID=UPI0031BAACDF